MKIWELFWLIIILFSLLSFTYMSVKILYKGYPELIDMFHDLKNSDDT